MHDLDRTQLEMESDEFESDYEFGDEYETGDYESDETGSPFSEEEEMELAADLLEVTDEYELDQFLGSLINRVKRTVGRALPPSIKKSLGGFLKGAVRKALPGLARTVGTALGGPAGAAIAGRIAPLAGRFFGLELEGLSSEDQEYEVARRMVRFAGSAAQQAAMTPPTASPQAAVQQAVASAAQQHAPGFLRRNIGGTPTMGSARGHSGRWIRRGRRIVLLGV